MLKEYPKPFSRHTPDRSGVPSAVRGAGAVRLGLPSGVRGRPGVEYLNHCAPSGALTAINSIVTIRRFIRPPHSYQRSLSLVRNATEDEKLRNGGPTLELRKWRETTRTGERTERAEGFPRISRRSLWSQR